jgi:trypsin
MTALQVMALAVAGPASAIVGGSDASAGDIPWIVSLSTSSHFCGGAILNNNTVLTAASCVDGVPAPNLRLRYGSRRHASGGTFVGVRTVVVHPDFSAATHANDIAILHTATPITFGPEAQPVSLPLPLGGLPGLGDDPAAGTDLLVAGWGTTSQGGSFPATLKKVTVPVVSRSSCRSSYGTTAITDAMLCAGVNAGGKDRCDGDVGGPATMTGPLGQPELVGVISWGRGCAQAGYPGVYTRVGAYELFITLNLLT